MTTDGQMDINELEELIGGDDGSFEYTEESFDGGKARKKKKRGGNEGGLAHNHKLLLAVLIAIILIAVFLLGWFVSRNSEGFVGSGINIGGSCCKTWHTPSLTEVEYPASDGCGTCNSACNLRFTPGAESVRPEPFVSDLGAFPDHSDPSCCAQPVRVTGCGAGQLGPYEFSESHLNSMLLNGDSM